MLVTPTSTPILSSGNANGNVVWNPDAELPELIQGGGDGRWLDARGVGVDLIDGRAENWEEK